jgi:hypothetical protein
MKAQLKVYHLSCSHTNGLDREFASAHIEQILQAGSQQIDDEDVVQTLLPKVVYLRYASCGHGAAGRSIGQREGQVRDY